MSFRHGELVTKFIMQDPGILKNFVPILSIELLTAPVDRQKVQKHWDRDEFYQAILLTMEIWIQNNASKATFGEFINILKANGFNKTAGEINFCFIVLCPI